MNEQVTGFLERAADALDDANFLHQHGRVLALANRAYYAVFYCTSALLLTEGIKTKKHEGARVKFHELFMKTGRIDRSAGQILERNLESRQSADYDMEADLSEDEAKELLEEPVDFMASPLTTLNKNPLPDFQ